MAAHIYLDESGDTGWLFDQPYTKGGSSRYLVIAASKLSPAVDHKPERMLRNLYKHRSWKTSVEKKWARMSSAARTEFAKNAANLVKTTPGVELFAIVADKRRVMDHIRRDPNKLYNYMVKLLLLEQMAKHDRVTFVPDPRSIKVESGNSLHDYLQTELWFSAGAKTSLETTPRDSSHCLNLQFTDMVAGVVQSHFEFGESRHWAHLQPHLTIKTLYFAEKATEAVQI
jgi:hypothetical protein